MKLDSSAFVADQDLIDALERRSTLVVCNEDRVLFNQGEEAVGLYIIRSGTATLTMCTSTGEILIHTPVGTGALLGMPGVIGSQPYSLTATATQGAELSFITRDDFAQIMLGSPALSLKVLKVLAAEVRTARVAIAQA